MVKLTQKQFLIFWILLLVVLPLVSYFFHATLPFHGDTMEKGLDGELDTSWAFPHIFYFWTSVIFWFTVLTNGILMIADDAKDEQGSFLFFIERPLLPDTTQHNQSSVPIQFPRWLKILFWLGLICAIIWVLITTTLNASKDVVRVYNTSKVYHNKFNQLTTERKGFYDKLWKTFLQKEKISLLNREAFIEVSRIIMENRKDGVNVTWKWVHENQQVPYSEFVKFYTDLSAYIQTERDAYYALEVECQTVATANNVLLDTFPNNLYNRFINCEPIHYEYGFLSDSTNNVFSVKSENVR